MYLLYHRKKGDKDWRLLENTVYVGENVAWAWANRIAGLFSEYKVVPIKVGTVHELPPVILPADLSVAGG